MFFENYLESVRLLNEMRDEGFNMTFVATRLRGLRDEIRADQLRSADQLRARDEIRDDNGLFGNFPLLTMMDLVEEQVRRPTPEEQAIAIQRLEENGRRDDERVREQARESRENRIIKKQRENGELVRYKVVSKQKLEQKCHNECIICQDKRKVKDMVITDCCTNFYCNPCLTEWTRTHNSCPTCRQARPTTMGFRQRSPPMPAQLFEQTFNH